MRTRTVILLMVMAGAATAIGAWRIGSMPPPEEELESALEFLRAASERRDQR